MKIVGLTGGIGSGKTTVANFFKDLGVPVYIADDAGKRLMATSEDVKKAVIHLFGKDAYIEGSLNRKLIAAEVFNDAEKLEQLNQIVHPAVAKDFSEWLSLQKFPYVIYEAAILFEAGGYKKCDLVLLVTAPKKSRLERVQKRDQSSLSEIEARMQHQWSDEQKQELANYEILNIDLDNTESQVKNLHEIFLNPIKK
ncbi:dephospho-CoA kinase [Gillisia sp. Hel1_33_143]|uniref:dephospho-CoA kinase n=1 Tax=Gillisia sp. Hel1_33_143 TaxID=1336796 RepID=UPI00087DDF45|nr:dephospho-CoA kinase [Gillisia sp. Hel1_33_143]SDS84563.1 dephospho-CoA kinase [Gillisia sp. Hel1_33_143]